tara:strand:- start:485 stop:916 length:432 start_codon:yes stop_codon:yes gene_type:complete
MSIEEQRNEYRRLRGQLSDQERKEWHEIVNERKALDPLTTPIEWIEQLSEFVIVCRFRKALSRWFNLRLSDEQFFGEDPDPTKDVGGFKDDLPIETKITLINRQFNEDLNYLTSYEDWSNVCTSSIPDKDLVYQLVKEIENDF